jgi:2-methylcitrate dehydratase PrpD
LGRFGVAAGIGKLMGLDSEMLNHAFGLAATQAGGIRHSFGTMAKPFHAGKAAMDGILSALLARDGFTACKDVLDEGSGFGPMLSPHFDHIQLNADLGKKFNVLDISFKPYAESLEF